MNHQKKKNNKGLTLVEVLITLLVMSIVLSVIFSFVSSGARFYNKQSNTINLQNELLQVSNKVTDSIMEATAIVMTTDTDTLNMYTGEYETNASGNPVAFTSDKGNSRYLYWNGTSFYATKSLSISGDDLEGYNLSDYVTEVLITIDDSCKVYQSSGGAFVGYSQPLIFNISITVSNQGTTLTDHKKTTVRDTVLDSLVINGVKQNLIQ